MSCEHKGLFERSGGYHYLRNSQHHFRGILVHEETLEPLGLNSGSSGFSVGNPCQELAG